MNYSNELTKAKKQKFTTNLSNECLKNLSEISHIIKVKNINEVIEYLVQKEIALHEVDKQRNTS